MFPKNVKKKCAIGCLLLLISVMLISCDKGKNTYEEAEALFNKLDYSAAKTKAQEVIKNSPKSKYVAKANELIEKINFKEAEMLFNKSNYADAKTKAQEIIKNSPESKKYVTKANELIGKINFKEAEVLFNNSNYADAKTKAQEVIKNSPSNDFFANANELIQKINHIEELIQSGDSEIKNGNYEKGMEFYEKVLLLDPNNKTVAQSKLNIENVLSEIKQYEVQGNKKKDGLVIKVIEARRKELESERGMIGCFPAIVFKVLNNTQYPVKIYLVKIKYHKSLASYGARADAERSFEEMKDKILFVDSRDLNKVLLKGTETKIISSTSERGSEWGCNQFNWNNINHLVELSIDTSLGEIYMEGYIVLPGKVYSEGRAPDNGFFIPEE